jgi:hypothetical protein
MPQEKKQAGADATPEEQASMVTLGKLMGDPRDDFDRQVEKHLGEDPRYAHEMSYDKMRAAADAEIGPSQFETDQAQQQQALMEQQASQGAMKAQQAQAAQMPIQAPQEPPGPIGSSEPYPAQQKKNQPPGAPGGK